MEEPKRIRRRNRLNKRRRVSRKFKQLVRLNLCCFGKHEYEVIQDFGDGTRRVGCSNCKQTWAMNDRTKSLLLWDVEFQSMYRNIFGFKITPPR